MNTYQRLFGIVALTGAIVLQACGAAVVAGVAGVALTAADRRSPGQVIDDQRIELHIASLLAEPPFDERSNVEAVAYNGIVLLVGQVNSPILRDNLSKAVQQYAPNALRIVNEIQVVTTAPDVWRQKTDDSLITSRVKFHLLNTSTGEGDNTTGLALTKHVKVITFEGVVYMFGLLTLAEQQQAVAAAKAAQGVRKVVTIFELWTPPATAQAVQPQQQPPSTPQKLPQPRRQSPE